MTTTDVRAAFAPARERFDAACRRARQEYGEHGWPVDAEGRCLHPEWVDDSVLNDPDEISRCLFCGKERRELRSPWRWRG